MPPTGDDVSEPQDDRLVLGAIVLIKVNKHEGTWNGLKGRIKAVLSREVKVAMLEVPEKGATNGFNPKCCT